MKIVVISDVHGSYKAMQDVYLKESDADYFFNLGDSELPSYLLSPFLSIKGNCDYMSDLELKKEIDIDNFKFHLEHGHTLFKNSNINDYIKSLNCDVFLFGHTHKKYASKLDDIYIFNPGSLTRPRDDENGSYLIININDSKLDYEFKTYLL